MASSRDRLVAILRPVAEAIRPPADVRRAQRVERAITDDGRPRLDRATGALPAHALIPTAAESARADPTDTSIGATVQEQLQDQSESIVDNAAAVAAHEALTAAHGATGAVVGTTNTQTLSGKTLTSPTFTGTVLINADGTQIFRVRNAAGTTSYFVVDTTNGEVEYWNGAKGRWFSNAGTTETASIDGATGNAQFDGTLTVDADLIIAAGGTQTLRLYDSGVIEFAVGSPNIRYVGVDPEGAVSAVAGSFAMRTNGTLYAKASGSGNTGWVALGAGSGAPTGATYITQTADAGLSAEQALSALATGLLKVTTTTGVLSTAVANTDYLTPAGGDALFLTPAEGNAAYQALNAILTDLAGLTQATDRLPYFDSATTAALATFTAAGRALIDDADAAAQRTTLGVVAGGAGDIWVEKAGDTMTGALVVSVTTGEGLLVRKAASGVKVFDVDSNTAAEAAQVLNGADFVAWSGDYTGQVFRVYGENGIIEVGAAGAPSIRSGAGTPEGAVSAPIGSIFLRTNGGTDTTVYRKESGAGNTGWVAVTNSGSGAPTTATYITQTANGSLSAEQALGALATGILKSTTTTGVVSIAAFADFPFLTVHDGKAQAASDTASSTDTTNYVDAISLAITLPTGTWTVTAVGSVSLRHSANLAADARAMVNAVGGTAYNEVSLQSGANNSRHMHVSQVQTGIAGGGAVTCKIQYRPSGVGTATAVNPHIVIVATRTA